MKTFFQFLSEAKKCPDGKYWCFTDKKCKKIPKGWHVMRGGVLVKDDEEDDENGGFDSYDGGDGGGVSESFNHESKAVKDLEYKLKKLDNISYESIDNLMRKIMKKNKMTARELHNAFVQKHDKTPDDWIKQINKRKKKDETNS